MTTYEDARRGIEAFVRSYNFERPHQGIGGGLPSDRFYGVVGEVSRVESELLNKKVDTSKGGGAVAVQGFFKRLWRKHL